MTKSYISTPYPGKLKSVVTPIVTTPIVAAVATESIIQDIPNQMSTVVSTMTPNAGSFFETAYEFIMSNKMIIILIVFVVCIGIFVYKKMQVPVAVTEPVPVPAPVVPAPEVSAPVVSAHVVSAPVVTSPVVTPPVVPHVTISTNSIGTPVTVNRENQMNTTIKNINPNIDLKQLKEEYAARNRKVQENSQTESQKKTPIQSVKSDNEDNEDNEDEVYVEHESSDEASIEYESGVQDNIKNYFASEQSEEEQSEEPLITDTVATIVDYDTPMNGETLQAVSLIEDIFATPKKNEGCQFISKSGKNKGKKCGKKCGYDEIYCKAHSR